MNESGLKEAILFILLIIFFMVSLYFSKTNTVTVQAFEKKISEETLAAGLYYSTQALPCLSRNPDVLDETKRFVLDRAILDTEAGSNGTLSCAKYGEIKYWLGVYDLDRKEGQWTFRNYMPPEDDKPNPGYGQIVLIYDGGKMHRAFVGVYVDMPEAKGKFPLWVFCNSAADCESGNCIKGPGQALKACQPKEYSYSKNAGDACELKFECKSLSCAGGKCGASSAPVKLFDGQPCKQNTDCVSNICAYDKRCRSEIGGGMDISPFKYT